MSNASEAILAKAFDPDFGTALEAAAAIRSGAISSVELTRHTLRRIDAFQPKLNAYVYVLREQALEAARRADESLKRGEAHGPLHGVPINVKESFGVAGYPCTWGIPQLKDSRAPQNATSVERLLDAGAILLGATNVPLYLMDGQAFNDIYGTSNNPWDLSRTPGGSSGGTSASLAAGMAFLSIGSDVGGSIRSPASFCGIYGHKPTLDLVSMNGHMPGGARGLPGFSTLLAAAGPMARSAADLETALNVLAGPEGPDSKAFRWELPPARHASLRDFRIGYVLEDPEVPVCGETKAVLETVVRALEKAGARVTEGWPARFRFRDLLDTYLFMLGALDFSLMPPERQQAQRGALERRNDPFARGSLGSFAEWQARNMKRLGFRALWESFFESTDVFLLPTTFTAAFKHGHAPVDERSIPDSDGRAHSFWDMVTYIAPATLTGCPATTAPAGLSRGGLPVGVQIVAPRLEDATGIRFAELLAREIGGFTPPPGY